MKNKDNHTILKAIAIFLLVFYIPILLFYLGIVIPEHFACNESMFEGENGISIWGDEVLCDGESKAFGKVLFQLISTVVGGFSVILLIVFFLMYSIKKTINSSL